MNKATPPPASIERTEGTLQEYPTPDLLGWMAQQRTTGMLTLRYKHQEIVTEWRQGQIVHLTEKPGFIAGGLGEMLLHIRAITPSQLEQALAQQRQSVAPLGEILSKLFQCNKELIRLALRVQALESLYSLFFWREGSFVLEARQGDPSLRGYDPIDVETLLLDAIPVIDSWAEVRKTLSSSQILFTRQVSVFPSWEEDGYSKLAHEIFVLLEQERSFREVAILSASGQYAAGRELVRLLKGGVIRINVPKHDVSKTLRTLLGGPVSHFAVWLLISTLLVGGGTFLLAFAPYSPVHLLRSQPHFSMPPRQWSYTLHLWRKAKIERALDVYRLSKGSYPTELLSLSKEGFLHARLLLHPNGQSYVYRRSVDGETFQLLLPLPDSSR